MKDNKIKRVFVNMFGGSKSYTKSYMILVVFIVAFIILPQIFIGMIIEKQTFSNMLLVSMKNFIRTEFFLLLINIFGILLFVDIIRSMSTIIVLTDIDLFNNKEVYRDIIYKYSPIGLAYIDDYKEDFYKYLALIVLSLQLKERIKLVENRIEVIDSNQYNLRESERYVLNNIRQGKIVIHDTYTLKTLAKKEASEDKLLDDKELYKWRFNFNINIFIVCAIIGFIVFINLVAIGIIDDFLLVFSIFAAPVILSIYFFIKSIGILATIKNPRSKLGKDINGKLEGLRNYIKEYSLLDEKEQKDLKLWKEYLIYSVMFNQNKKILNEVRKLIIFE